MFNIIYYISYSLRIIIYLMLLLLSVKFGTSSRRRVFDRWSLGSDRKSFGEERAIVKVWSRIFIDTSVNFDVHCRFRTKKKCAECTGWIARDVWLTIDQGEWHFCKRNLDCLLLYLTYYFVHIIFDQVFLLEHSSCWSKTHDIRGCTFQLLSARKSTWHGHRTERW
jgi:hypothetical protein